MKYKWGGLGGASEHPDYCFIFLKGQQESCCKVLLEGKEKIKIKTTLQ